MQDTNKTALESTVVSAVNSFIKVDKAFTSLDVTNYIHENVDEEILHKDVADEVRKLYVKGFMNKNKYCSDYIQATLNSSNTSYVTALYHSTLVCPSELEEETLSLRYKSIKKKGKCENNTGSCVCSNVVRVDQFHNLESFVSYEPNESEPVNEYFKAITSDGRLEVPQELLTASGWLDNNKFISVVPGHRGFVMGDFEDVSAIDFEFTIRGDRVKIPKTVFNIVGLSTLPGTLYKISYVEETDMIKVEILEMENKINQFQIKRIIITKKDGLMDIVVLETTMPDACKNPPNPKRKEPTLCLMFYATGDEGEEYCKTHFPGIDISVVNNTI